MSIDRQPAQPSAEDKDARPEFSDDAGEALIELLEELDAMNRDPDKSPLNKYSMDDNNGGRIEFIQRLARKLPAFFIFEAIVLHPSEQLQKLSREVGFEPTQWIPWHWEMVKNIGYCFPRVTINLSWRVSSRSKKSFKRK